MSVGIFFYVKCGHVEEKEQGKFVAVAVPAGFSKAEIVAVLLGETSPEHQLEVSAGLCPACIGGIQ